MAKVEIWLKEPCPKCGNTKEIQIFGFCGDWWLKCPKCHYTSEGGATLEEAQDDWNRRADHGREKA